MSHVHRTVFIQNPCCCKYSKYFSIQCCQLEPFWKDQGLEWVFVVIFPSTYISFRYLQFKMVEENVTLLNLCNLSCYVNAVAACWVRRAMALSCCLKWVLHNSRSSLMSHVMNCTWSVTGNMVNDGIVPLKPLFLRILTFHCVQLYNILHE
jgi:hypothetical protein